jgi:hypothetical protein
MKGNIQDSIYRNISDWEKPQIPEHLKSKDPWLIISQIQSDTTKISLIHRADFLTDNKILITYSMENRRPENDFYIYHLYFDIWEEIDNQWTLVEKDVSINSLQRNDYTKPDVFFGMDYEISNGFFIFPYYNRDTYSDFKIIVRKIK